VSNIQFNHEFDPAYGEIVDVAPGIRRVVANNPGPFTGPGTSTYIIGRGQVAVIDPGPMIPDHVDALLNGLGKEEISHIIVTHTHSDHSPASRLLKQRTGAPVFAFSEHSEHSAGALEGGVDREFMPDFELGDDELISGSDWALQAIHTPGHCANHLCFALRDPRRDDKDGAIFCGDHLMAWSTTVILPPDGSVREYLASLDKLQGRDEGIYYPTHGAAITEPGRYIEQIRQHRLQRVREVEEALSSGCQSTAELRARIYPDIPHALHGGAELSIQATLKYLNDDD